MGIMDRFPGIYALHSDERDRLLQHLKTADVCCFEMDGSSVFDTAAFYRAAAEALPMDPPLRGTNRNWDAFSDSLYNGLDDLRREQVAIICTDAHVMANTDLSGLIEVCIVMEHVIRDLEVPSGEMQTSTRLIFILLGRGDGFGRIDTFRLDSIV